MSTLYTFIYFQVKVGDQVEHACPQSISDSVGLFFKDLSHDIQVVQLLAVVPGWVIKHEAHLVCEECIWSRPPRPPATTCHATDGVPDALGASTPHSRPLVVRAVTSGQPASLTT